MSKWILASLVFCSFALYAEAKTKSVPGEYVVKIKPTIAEMSVSTLRHVLGGDVKEMVASDVVLLKYPSEKKANALKQLNGNPFVEYAEPNYIYQIVKTPDDKEYAKLWGMKNSGQDVNGSVGVKGIDIGAEAAWDITTGSKNVVIAIIDTGVNYKNADLKDNIWVNEKEAAGKSGVDDDGNGFVDDIYGYDFANKDSDPMDDHGHGTHVSGTIGGSGNNGKDVAGVNWNVKIMAIKFLKGDGGGTLADAIKAIDYATTMGARISNNSWGGGGYSKALEEAIQRAADKNSLFVAAAGNSAKDNDATPNYPSNYEIENVLAVAAIDNKGALANFSCYGKKSVDVAAPGVNILSFTTKGLEAWSGTSMATPHVAGIAGLLLANEPGLKATEIKDRIIKTAAPLASMKNKSVSGGLANAFNALTNTTPPPDPNDPANWKLSDYALSTDHPYADNANLTFTVKVEGAKKFSVHFSKFETEKNFDFVEFFDGAGNKLDKWTGLRSDEFSPVVAGDTLVLKLTSDESQSKHGFDIDKLAVAP